MSDILKGEKILCIFPDTWDELKRGRHQIIGRLLKNNEVLVIEDPLLSVLSIFRDRRRLRRLWSWARIRRSEKNLLLYEPVLVVPFALKSEVLRKISEWILRINIRLVLKRLRFQPTLLYLSIPSLHGLIHRFDVHRSVYVAHDAWEVYPDERMLADAEEKTLKKVDLAIFNARPNMERKAHLNPKSYYVPHGCPDPALQPASTARPVDFPDTGELFLGYWGYIDRGSVDADLLLWLAHRHPEWTIVLVGGIYPRDRACFRKLEDIRNIVFLGHKPAAQRFAYLNCFDLALLCACPSDVELKASQLKFWEYAAIGLPVVGIPVEEYIGYDWFYVARNRGEWEEMIARAARENTPERRRHRIDFARVNTWEKRVLEISALIERVIPNDPARR